MNFLASTGINAQPIVDAWVPYVNIGLWLIFGIAGLAMTVKTSFIIFHIGMAADDPEKKAELKKTVGWPLAITIGLFAVPTIANSVFAALGFNLSLNPTARG